VLQYHFSNDSDDISMCRTIRRCLRLDEPNCMITKQCILEGELIVYSDMVRDSFRLLCLSQVYGNQNN
jgi:hypothetical protein